MSTNDTGVIETLFNLPIFEASWVMWLLIAMSIVSVAIMLERAVFYTRHKVDVREIKEKLFKLLDDGNYADAEQMLAKYDSLETNVARYGLQHHTMGPEAVEDLMSAEGGREQTFYSKRLGVLATVAANAPFIGLLGTVLGIVKSFNDLAGNMNEASTAVMAGIAEALITTAAGLIVAIPAIVMFNLYKARVNNHMDNMQTLASVVTASMKNLAPADQVVPSAPADQVVTSEPADDVVPAKQAADSDSAQPAAQMVSASSSVPALKGA